MTLENILRKAVLRLILDEHDDDDFQSCWLCSADGHILTAGHGFRENGAAAGDKFIVSHAEGRWTGEARLIEFGKGKGDEPDYALLELVGGAPKGMTHLPVSNQIFRRKLKFPQLIVGFGYSQSLGRTQYFEGKLTTLSCQYTDLPTARFQLDTGKHEAPGLSGCPLMANCASEDSGVIALQVLQGGNSHTRQIFFGQPLSAILQHSREVSDVLNRQHELDAIRRWKLHRIERDQFATLPVIPRTQPRAIWSIRPLGQKVLGASVHDRISGRTNQFIQLFERMLARQMWLDPSHRKNLLKCEFGFTNWHWDPTGEAPTLDLLFGPEATALYQSDIPFVRVILDFTGQLDLAAHSAHVRRKDVNFSHLVVVKLGCQEARIRPSPDGLVDLLLELEGWDVELSAKRILALVKDVLLDANIFYALPILRSLFSNPDGKKALSRAKVNYIRLNGGSIYGLPLPHDGVSYLPVSGLARERFDSETAEAKLEFIWRHFVNVYLCPALVHRVDGISPAIPDEEAIDLFCKSAKIGGQISKRRLATRLSALGADNGSLVALAKVVSEPADRKARVALRQFFRPGIRVSRMIGAFRIADLPRLCSFGPHVKIMIFRRGESL